MPSGFKKIYEKQYISKLNNDLGVVTESSVRMWQTLLCLMFTVYRLGYKNVCVW